MKSIKLRKDRFYKIIKPNIVIGRTYCRFFPEEFTALTNQLIFSPKENIIIRLDDDGCLIKDRNIKTSFLTTLSNTLKLSITTTYCTEDSLESLNIEDFFFLERIFRNSEYVLDLKNKKIIKK